MPKQNPGLYHKSPKKMERLTEKQSF